MLLIQQVSEKINSCDYVRCPCVSAKFDCCALDKGSSFSEPLKEYLLECEELQGFDTEVFPLIIEKIIVNRDSSINIELVNGQIVNSNGKEC